VRIRNVRENDTEWQQFLRFLEASYGNAPNWFPDNMPHVYKPTPGRLETFWIVEEDDRIVSHVGLFPLHIHVGNVGLTAGGIGGVATLPEYRGRGYMSALLRHVIAEMRQKRMPVSVLWGRRQRYGRFGWELAGVTHELHFTGDSLAEAWKHPDSVREVTPVDGLAEMRDLYTHGGCWTQRDDMMAQLSKAGLRMWLSESGYVCAQIQPDSLLIHEVFSSCGREPSMIAGVMQSLSCSRASLSVAPEDSRLDALCELGAWQTRAAACYRINDTLTYLRLIAPLVAQRLQYAAAPEFTLLVEVDGPDELQAFRIGYRGGEVHVSSEVGANSVQLGWREWVRFLFGGPLSHTTRASLGPLGLAFPLGLNVPLLDHI